MFSLMICKLKKTSHTFPHFDSQVSCKQLYTIDAHHTTKKKA